MADIKPVWYVPRACDGEVMFAAVIVENFQDGNVKLRVNPMVYGGARESKALYLHAPVVDLLPRSKRLPIDE